MTVLPSGLQLTWNGATGRSPGLPDRHGGDPAGVGDGADGAAPGDPVQDAGLANFLLIHEYALLLEKRIKFFSTLTKSISNKWKKIHIKYAVRNTS